MNLYKLKDEDRKFSIHTFMLTKVITAYDAKNIRKKVKGYYKNEVFYIFKNGIYATIIDNKKSPPRINLEINPHLLLISGDITCEDYLRIFTYTRENMKAVEDKVNIFLQQLIRGLRFKDMALSRVDLCVNKYFGTEEILKTYMKLLKKLSHKKTYKPTEFSCDFSDYKEMNKNSIRLKNGQRMITIYNKIYQQKQRGYLDNVPETILRFEVSLLREEIYTHYQKPYKINNPIALLSYITSKSEEIIKKNILDLNLNLPYFKYHELFNIIQGSNYYCNTKDMMINLAKAIKKTKSINTALNNINHLSSEQEKKRLLEKFIKLNINPVTINKKSDCDKLPSLYELLFKNNKN